MTQVNVYSIDSGVPLPNSEPVPLDKLEIGDSILFPGDKRNNVQSMASRLKKKTDKEFRIRKMDDENCRVWRIK